MDNEKLNKKIFNQLGRQYKTSEPLLYKIFKSVKANHKNDTNKIKYETLMRKVIMFRLVEKDLAILGYKITPHVFTADLIKEHKRIARFNQKEYGYRGVLI